MTRTYVQICLKQTDDFKAHVTEQVPHAALTIAPRVVDAKMHCPDANIQYPSTCMCGRKYWRRWGRPPKRVDECSNRDKGKGSANVTMSQARNGSK